MNILIKTMWIILLSLTLVSSVQATDRTKEQRWANQIAEFLNDGELRWFDANDQKFLGIYTPAAGKLTRGAVILLHGRGAHPDWPQVIQPLRTRLPTKGWATLSLQMPVLQQNAVDEDYVPLFKEVPARIQAGLEFLDRQGINNIVLIGHDLGANMATDYLAKHHDPRIKAFVGIGMMGKPRAIGYMVLDNVVALFQMQVPVLDIYGSKTDPIVLESVDRRAYVIYHSELRHSAQLQINNANHSFQKHEDELLQAITNWIDRYSEAKPLEKMVSSDNKIYGK